MKKRIISICLTVILTTAVLAPAAQAANIQDEIFSSVTDFENGVTVETTLVIQGSNSLLKATSTKSATKIDVYKYNGTEIATVSLTASFGYDGSSSWVNSSSVTKSVASGWTYSGESLTSTGGTAKVTATLTNLLTLSIAVDTSMSCTATGTIS